MERLKAYLDTVSFVDEKDWEFLCSRLEPFSFDKKEITLKMGAVENYLNFLTSGVIRSYLPKDENDVTFGFSFEDNLASGYDSFITQSPSTFQMETLVPVMGWRISHAGLAEVYEQTKVGCTLGRLIAETLIVKSIKREISLLNTTAEERYQSLFVERPELIKEIPLKYLASYIGVTPQALSRIRKRIS